MSSNWPLKKISEIANFLNNKRIPLKSLDRQKRQGSYPYYGASGIVDSIDGYIFDGTYLLISEDGENLRTRKTPIAFKAHGKFWVNNHAHILSEQEEGVLDYLEYYFSTLDLNPYITGAAQPKLNKANLDSINIPFPDRSVRLFINSTLNSLTQKIATNNQINQTLEQMAQALFKSWFVDFEPVKAKMSVLEAGGSQEDATLAAITAISGKEADALAVFEREHPEQYAELKATAELFPSAMQESELGVMPEGWSVASISEMGKVTCGKTPSKKEPQYFGDDIPFIKIPDMHGQLFVLKTNEYLSAAGSNSQLKKLVPANSICVSCIATIGVVSITNEPSHTNQQINSVTPHKSSLLYYLYFSMLGLKDYLHVLGSAGSATLNVNTSTFSGIKIAQPNDKVLELFHAKCTHLFNEIKSLSVQTESLIQLRDTLLPKLLSGEITLPEVEQAVSEAENV